MDGEHAHKLDLPSIGLRLAVFALIAVASVYTVSVSKGSDETFWRLYLINALSALAMYFLMQGLAYRNEKSGRFMIGISILAAFFSVNLGILSVNLQADFADDVILIAGLGVLTALGYLISVEQD
ncbi:hypothetical protein A2415_00825 [candidate division WWE3 bacterium RIFOXYC1_FULL_39_7]|uniref:Uncharacterized protein n=2 Tax=Katanobacteria TaxID=422282 RepID=A0A1F4X704_UNCKA|nr:MAG: hypothetical protein A2415_00825 [candidate division WWE3 bacterium RIFOXYC1_FULL_39_7]OGC77464.1 MAG: hypothetical protein A2619_03905 [candidate division WWE3 bacterium RIFOXYD1_FULL_39_9]